MVGAGARGGTGDAVGTGSAAGVEVGVAVGPVGVVTTTVGMSTGIGCWAVDVALEPESPDPPDPSDPNAEDVAVLLASFTCPGACTAGVGVAVTITVTYITTGVAVKVGTVTTVGDATGAVTGGTDSESHAVSASSVTTAGITIPPRRLLVVVPRVVVRRVVWPGVVVRRLRRAMLVIMGGIKSWTARMDRVVVAERNAFEVARRPPDVFGLTESHIVRYFAFEDEVRRLFCR